MSQPPDDKSIDFHGMPVKISDFFPDNLIGINTGDKRMVMDFGPTGDRTLIEFKTDASHKLFDTPCRWTPMPEPLSDDAMAEVYANAASRRSQEAWYNMYLGTFTATTPEPAEPLTLDKLDKLMTEAAEKTRQLDRDLIKALLSAGIDVQVTNRETRPLASLPRYFHDAAKAVAAEEFERPADFGESVFTKRGRLYL